MNDYQREITRRFESFSDIIIGLSLAQIGLNLIIPQHAALFVTRPIALVAFVVTFAVVARFWWVHGRMYRAFFVPNTATIVLNFAALGSICLQVYVLQIVVHFATAPGEEIAASCIYFGVFSLTFTLLAALTATCLRDRWDELDEELRRYGVRAAAMLAGIAAGMIVGTALAATLAGGLDYWNPLARVLTFLLGCTLAGVFAGRLLASIAVKRFV